MLNGRLYRVGLVPVLLALVVAAFSLQGRPAPLRTRHAPEAFEGKRAYSDLGELAREFAHRRPGETGDSDLAGRVARLLAAPESLNGGGFTVHATTVHAQTIAGEQELQTVIAERPGTGDGPGIVILAHRDASGSPSEAQLSGTAVLLELARDLAHTETKRTLYVVSTSGGSGGDAGVLDFLRREHGPLDAAIVLGDLAGKGPGGPYVYPFSDGLGSAPLTLAQTVSRAIDQQGLAVGEPSLASRLTHLAYPLTLGEQGPLEAEGVPAVAVGVGGEAGPGPAEPVSEDRLTELGRGVLSALYALDEGPDLAALPEGVVQRGLQAQRKVIPEWAVRLVVGMLLVAPLLVLADALARMDRRGQPVLRSLLWGLSCALPFLLCALFALALGAAGALGATPAGPIAGGTALSGSAVGGVVGVGLVLVLAWLLWPALLARAGLAVRPPSEAAGVPVLALFALLSALVWLVNPYEALLMVPALHLWLGASGLSRPAFASPPRLLLALALLLAGLIPLALELASYATLFGLSPWELLRGLVLMVGSGSVGWGGLVIWSLSLGCLAALVLLALLPERGAELVGPPGGPADGERGPAIRGPGSYIGPGSLGGTPSALRR